MPRRSWATSAPARRSTASSPPSTPLTAIGMIFNHRWLVERMGWRWFMRGDEPAVRRRRRAVRHAATRWPGFTVGRLVTATGMRVFLHGRARAGEPHAAFTEALHGHQVPSPRASPGAACAGRCWPRRRCRCRTGGWPSWRSWCRPRSSRCSASCACRSHRCRAARPSTRAGSSRWRAAARCCCSRCSAARSIFARSACRSTCTSRLGLAGAGAHGVAGAAAATCRRCACTRCRNAAT
jgi:hypothetical protein